MDRIRMTGAGDRAPIRMWKPALAAGIAVLTIVPQVLFIANDLGLGSFMAHRRAFLSAEVVENMRFMLTCLVRMVPVPLWPVAALGLYSALRLKRTGDRYLISLLLVLLVISPWYQPYPRLYLPLALGVALLAGRGVSLVSQWVGGRGQWVPILLATIVSAWGAWECRDIQFTESGYRDAAMELVELGLTDRPPRAAGLSGPHALLSAKPSR